MNKIIGGKMKGRDLKAKISVLIYVFDEEIVNWEGHYNPAVYLNLLGELKRSLNHEIRCAEKDLENLEYKIKKLQYQ